MLGPRTILLAGWKGEPPRLGSYSVRIIALSELAKSVRRARNGTILLLGEEAMRLLSPEMLQRTFLHRCVAFGVYRDTPSEEALAWARSRVIDVVHEKRVLSRIRQVSRILRRPDVPWEEWVPAVPVPGTLADRMIRVFPALNQPLVVVMSRTLEVERHVLIAECKATFGITPEELCWRYVEAFVRQERRKGTPITRIADALGYGDTRTLWRKYRDQGTSIPPAGPGQG